MIISEAGKLKNVKEYYFSRKLQQIGAMRKSGIDVINMGIGSPDLMPSLAAIDVLGESAKNPGNHGYQNYRCIPEFRKAIEKWYDRIYGVKLNHENEILPLIGSKEGIMHISMSFLNQNDKVLVPNPGYPTYTSVSNLVGAEIVKYDLDENNNWAVNFEKLKQKDLSNVKIMWVNYPNMPTGAKASDQLFEQLIRLASDNKFLICNDNPYSLILNDTPRSILKYDGAKEVALELNSMSKSHNMAGWRLGWVSGNKDYINTIVKFKSNMDSGIFLPMQHAAIEALNNTDEWHQKQNDVYAERRKYVKQIFDKLNCRYTNEQVGMFVWAKIPESIKDVETWVEDILQKTHVFITPGFIFGSNGERYVRISLCNSVDIIKTAINRIAKFII